MIGDLLVASRVITPAQLDLALREQARTGAALGDVLVATRALSEDALSRALAAEARVPFASLEGAAPDPSAVRFVPEAFARARRLVPVSYASGRLSVAQADPFDVPAADELQRVVDVPVDLVCAPGRAVVRLIDAAYGAAGTTALQSLIDQGLESLAQPQAECLPETSPVVRLIDTLLLDAVRAGASDLHVDPEDASVRIRHRVDGVLSAVDALPRDLLPPLVSRLKVLAGLDIAEQRLPQEGRITRNVEGRSVDFRVSTFPTVFGEKVAVRVLEKARLVRGLGDLGLDRQNLARFRGLLSRSRGIVLVTGPTGAGKTTTLYSALNALGGAEKNIMTVEDPVEYEVPTLRQTQVRPRAGLTFASAIRSLLRQDPDVIMIGEIRDPETAQLAVRAALSGVLVFSTLHTQDAAGAAPRLMDMGVEPYLLASALAGVVNQRLVRLVCPACRTTASYPPDVLSRLGLEAGVATFVRGRGCVECGQTGYRGRTGVYEILAVEGGLNDLIHARADSTRIRAAAVRSGFSSLLDDARAKATAGLTTLDEVLRVAYE